MGKLEKYAKKPATRRSKSLSTKLSQQEYQDFLAYIKPLPNVTNVVPMVAEPSIGKRWTHLLNLHWDEKGKPYVEIKTKKDEPEDVTLDEIQYAISLYQKAGIDIR